MIEWRGVNRYGVAGTGQTDESAYALMLRLFSLGFRAATATRDGVQVGGIGQHPDTGKRNFWGES